MVIETPIPAGEYVPTADQRVVRYGVPWSHFLAELELRGDRSAPRLAYLNGALEIMTPSRHHERIKSALGRLLEAYAMEHDLELTPYGGWTLKNQASEAGLEPDECYIFGEDQAKEVPDLAIEVTWTSGGINKLEIYRRLAVAEVWVWKNDALRVFVLAGGHYEESRRSRLLPNLDIELLLSYLDYPTVTQAAKAFRKALRTLSRER